MSQPSTQRKNTGSTDLDLMVAIALPILFFVFMAFLAGKDDFDDWKNCQSLSDSFKELSGARDDSFVVDVSKLIVVANTDQPENFWIKAISEEAGLLESEDYIAIGNGENKRYLLTINATYGFAARTIEADVSNSGWGRSKKKETYIAQRIINCLQKPYFPKVTGNAQ